MSPAGAPGRGDARAFGLALAILALASLLPVWLPRHLPLQDLPQHLFIAQVLASYDAPALNWRETYDAALAVGPYASFYAFAAGLGRWLGVDVAARLFFSACLLLTAAAAALAWRRRPSPAAPWPLLLMLPASFSQVWYLGFANYLLSIPLLLLALLALARAPDGPPAPPGRAAATAGLRLAPWIVLLFLTHPYTLLVFAGLATVAALDARRDPAAARRAAAAAALALALALGWWMLQPGAQPVAGGLARLRPEWVAPAELLRWLLLPFAGLRWNGGIDPLAAALWAAAVLLVLAAARRPATRCERAFARHAAVVLAAYLVLPFWLGEFSYFNLRLAPLLVLLVPLALAGIPLRRSAGLALAGLCLALVGHAAWLHQRLSDEVAEIAPLFAEMRPNASLRRILHDAAPRAIDAGYFPEFHAHAVFLYHLAVGGGANPYLLPNPMMPVRYNPAHADWARAAHAFDPGIGPAGAYDYLLVRGAGPLPAGLRLLGRSGAWSLHAPAP